MSMTILKNVAEKNLQLLNQFKELMEEVKYDLEIEQANNEDEREAWDEESGGPEPDEIDNEKEISLLHTQLLDLDDVINGFDEIVGALR